MRHPQLAQAIRELANLPDGWLDSSSVAPYVGAVNELADLVDVCFPDGLEYPCVVPTGDGSNINMEWIRPDIRIELEFIYEEKKIELNSLNLVTHKFHEQMFDYCWLPAAFDRAKKLLEQAQRSSES